MEKRAYDLVSKINRGVAVKVIPGHIATKHSHVNYCVDMTKIKSQLGAAKAAAKMLADTSFFRAPWFKSGWMSDLANTPQRAAIVYRE